LLVALGPARLHFALGHFTRMTRRDIRVLQKRVRCFKCGTEFDGYTEAPDEGFGYAHQLFECSGCHTLFSRSIEDEHYGGSLQSRIVGVSCPTCAGALADTLHKVEFAGVCPGCGQRDYAGTDEAREAVISSYQLYE